MKLKVPVVISLAAALAGAWVPAPAAAQTNLVGRALVEICLPYAGRQRSFERAISKARDLRFRRPTDDRARLEEFASEVEMVSRDGVWRLRLEENTIDVGDRSAYAITCSLSSRRASARDLTELGRRAFGNERFWTMEEAGRRGWNRRTRNPDEYQLRVRVDEGVGRPPALQIQGLYF